MLKKALALISFATGYVLGARAGRERYEQLRKVALRIKDDPHVQHAVDEATGRVHPQAPPREPFVPRQGAGLGR
jgi:hypothetical protein